MNKPQRKTKNVTEGLEANYRVHKRDSNPKNVYVKKIIDDKAKIILNNREAIVELKRLSLK